MSLPRAYIRIDPNMDSHPDPEAMLLLILWGNRQAERGRFRTLSLVSKVLGKRRLDECILREDLILLDDGRYYISGWDEWQEGDLTVQERMGRVRKRRSMRTKKLQDNDRNSAVTLPSPDRNSPSKTIDVDVDVDVDVDDRRGKQRERDTDFDEVDRELADEEKRFTGLMISIRDSGRDVQQVLDSLPRSSSRAPFSAFRWLRTGLSGVPATQGGLTVLRLVCDALEASERALTNPVISERNRFSYDAIDRVADRLTQQLNGRPKEIAG